MIDDTREARLRLGRGDIESLCLLGAIPKSGCTLSELSARLGLSPLLAESVAEAIAPLINAGWIHESDDRMYVTAAGHAWLTEQLAGLG